MARIALIQDLFPLLHQPQTLAQGGLSAQLYQKFYEVLEEESGHQLDRAKTLAAYENAHYPPPEIVICTPFPEEGNLAEGFKELAHLRARFPDVPLIVWTTRQEPSVKISTLADYKADAFYTGTLIEAPEGLADIILSFLLGS